MDNQVDLEEVRSKLIRLEDNIIFSLFERAEYKTNNIIYIPGGIKISNFDGSFIDFMLKGTEELHSKAGRYLDQRQHPFFEGLPQPVTLRRKEEPIVSERIIINKNPEIKKVYLESVHLFCESGDDNQYGSSAELDVRCLQNLSKRIHFGAFVAENKFRKNKEEYTELALNGDFNGIEEKLRDRKVEKNVLDRVKQKGEKYNVNPTFIQGFYRDRIMPLTITVEVEYLIKRGLGK
jgi:chorismate mutase